VLQAVEEQGDGAGSAQDWRATAQRHLTTCGAEGVAARVCADAWVAARFRGGVRMDKRRRAAMAPPFLNGDGRRARIGIVVPSVNTVM
jgi:hypothetical protein